MNAQNTAQRRTSKTALKALNPRNHRKLLSFWRILKYGMSSFFRNAWLSLAATVIMVITLVIIAVTFVARQVMVDTVTEIKDKVDMSIYVKQDTSPKDIASIKASLLKLDSVVSVKYTTPEQFWEDIKTKYIDNADIMSAISEASEKPPIGVMNIKVKDISHIEDLTNLVNTNKLIKASMDENYPPSFSDSRRTAIDNISRTMDFVQKGGLIAGVLFIIIASLIIFNTIRMAIFNRRDEIYMMKLIGANKSFIRGPFIVEAVQYGVLAAIVTAVIITTLLVLAKSKLIEYGIAVGSTYNLLTTFWPLAVLILMFIGTTIGVVSSLLATRKYLKLN
ncbi:permease-like cell division protein FtsX [Candidatus Saccharibacteria bacterium]|nr:permease-like cell division protein FtsX [Candidatus Saccharibacteria bacterium]